MNANFAAIMPQVIAVWCEEEGHEVTLVCYTGFENLVEELPADVDLVFIGAFTESAQLAYALSNRFRAQGALTVLGGPHARCYPQDARKYMDAIEEAVPPDSIDFIAESSLSLLSEPRLVRLK